MSAAPGVPHLLMSVSKSVTSTVVGVLVGRGLLDASALVTEFVPELHGTLLEGATVQHLFDMRAGTRFDEDYDNPEADVRTYERVYLWRPDDGQARWHLRHAPGCRPVRPNCSFSAATRRGGRLCRPLGSTTPSGAPPTARPRFAPATIRMATGDESEHVGSRGWLPWVLLRIGFPGRTG